VAGDEVATIGGNGLGYAGMNERAVSGGKTEVSSCLTPT
jgi:hypothetical protein